MTTIATTPALEKSERRKTGWETVLFNRMTAHSRPQTQDYLDMIFFEVQELHGDRKAGDDKAMFAGFASMYLPGGKNKFDRAVKRCVVIGHRKGHDLEERKRFKFGYASPQGYRKSLRVMKLAEKFGLPVITFVDTAGAAADEESERFGQSQAIAENLREMSRLRTPIITVLIGEGGSGGALAIAIADKIAILENAWFTVASPEAASAIVYKDKDQQSVIACANAMKITAWDNFDLGLVDQVLGEPEGGAHLDPQKMAATVHEWIYHTVCNLQKTIKPKKGMERLLESRFERFRRIGHVDHKEIV